MKLFNKLIHNFRQCESGAVTVDFVVLTSAIVLLGFTAVTSFDDEVVDIANDISNMVREQETSR